jgi:hypothetical protein
MNNKIELELVRATDGDVESTEMGVISGTPATEALLEAFRARIVEGAAKQLTPRTMLEIAQLAELARKTLVVCKNPFQLRQRNKLLQFKNGEDFGDNDDEDGGEVAFNGAQFSGAHTKAETFGATIVRELVAIAKNLATRPSATDTVTAIALAKHNNMPELAAKMERELLPGVIGLDPEPGAVPAFEQVSVGSLGEVVEAIYPKTQLPSGSKEGV